MSVLNTNSYACGSWIEPDDSAIEIRSAINNEIIARAGHRSLPESEMAQYARDVGGPNLRRLTFHDRARLLKAIAAHLTDYKQRLYDLSFDTGATQQDHLIDIDGGIGTAFVVASKARRELPDSKVYLDGRIEQLSRSGSFIGQHIYTPKHGVAVHINAFNFPVWGMLEKLAPCLIAGLPVIVKPATATAYVTEACVRLILESNLLPAGALQLISGPLTHLLDHLEEQDSVSFTGSAETANLLRKNSNLIEKSVAFNAEQDSLNASVLGEDAVSGSPEFQLFIDEVVQEMTTKAGQKCTAIRRLLVPQAQTDAVINSLTEHLSKVNVGDPRDNSSDMGALVSIDQKNNVLAQTRELARECECVYGGEVNGHSKLSTKNGAFMNPMLFHCAFPDSALRVHNIEAFGPVSTLMGYRDTDHAVTLMNLGRGSLVASAFTHDADVAKQITFGAAAWHGRIYINNRDCRRESTGHGSPMPHMTHGGPGRAGGGEELGGIRAVLHAMQRTAVQGSPEIIAAIAGQWNPGAPEIEAPGHPFTRGFEELHIGETLHTANRTVTLSDIEHFAAFTGDNFYAHMNEAAASRNPFFPGRVAHGYLLLSFAAGLFVEPKEGPVLANTGLDNLRFLKPVVPGDTLSVRLTVKQKTKRNEDYGEVRWDVCLLNQDNEIVATYDLLTMVRY